MRLTYYQILNALPNDSSEVIRMRYKSSALRWHPDRNNGRDTTAQMQKLNEDYAVLSNPERRERYDQQLRIEQEQFYRGQTEQHYQKSKPRTSNNTPLEQTEGEKNIKLDRTILGILGYVFLIAIIKTFKNMPSPNTLLIPKYYFLLNLTNKD
jgi:curved DNA-binding protein CbpA